MQTMFIFLGQGMSNIFLASKSRYLYDTVLASTLTRMQAGSMEFTFLSATILYHST